MFQLPPQYRSAVSMVLTALIGMSLVMLFIPQLHFVGAGFVLGGLWLVSSILYFSIYFSTLESCFRNRFDRERSSQEQTEAGD